MSDGSKDKQKGLKKSEQKQNEETSSDVTLSKSKLKDKPSKYEDLSEESDITSTELAKAPEKSKKSKKKDRAVVGSDSDSESTNTNGGSTVTSGKKHKSKKSKTVEVEVVGGAENDAVSTTKSKSSKGGFMSLLGLRRPKKAIEKELSELTHSGHDNMSPRGDAEEEEAIAALLKSPNTQHDAPTSDLNAADYLRSVMPSGALVAGAVGLPSGPAPPLARTAQNVTFADLKGANHEPVSDSQVTSPISNQTSITDGLMAPQFQLPSKSLADADDQALHTSSPSPGPITPNGELQNGSDSPQPAEQQNLPASSSPHPTISSTNHKLQSSELGQYFYSRMQGASTKSETLHAERQKEEERQAKKRKERSKANERDQMKFNREDGRFKYKGSVVRISIADEKKDSYEIVKFSHNAWSGVRYYWVPDGEGKLSYITGERQYLGGWKKGVRHGEGEGSLELKDVEGVYSGEWKSGKASGHGKFFAKRFTYEGGWKEGLRHGFGEYVKEHLHFMGDWADDKKHGYGIATYVDGTRYEGEWEDDERHGFGVCKYPDGSIYTGMWADNQRHGEGTSIYVNGNRYVGSWYKDMKQGKGTLYGALHQKLYEGNWWRNKRHGQGTGWFLDSGDRYEGEWLLGKQHGEGDWFGADGSSYKGSYVDGFRQGTGLVEYASGDRYVGEWVRGLREGAMSAYVYKDYGKFIGPFVADRACGQGEYITFASRKIAGVFEEMTIEDETGRYQGLTLAGKKFGRGTQSYPNGDRYEGEWRDGLRTGYGVMQYEDGGRYVGFWMRDQRSKLGTYSLPSGEKYIGRWLKDKRHGVGTIIFENKDRLVDALWVDDAPMDGKGEFVFANRSVYRGPLQNGIPHGRGSLTVFVSVLLKERMEHRKQIGMHYFLKGEKRAAAKLEDHPVLGDAMDDVELAEEGIERYVDSAKRGKKAPMAALDTPETITFWRDFKDGVVQNGPGVSLWNGNTYEGDFEGLERCGVGKMVRTNGETYYGQWQHDREWGLGEVRTRNGDLYIGHWYNGYRNGVGSQSYDEGGIFYGKWMNDRRHGIGVFVWPDKTMVDREYYKGELISKRNSDVTFTRKQLAAWGVERFPDNVSRLPFPFNEWAKEGLPTWYTTLMETTRGTYAEDPLLETFRSSMVDLPHAPVSLSDSIGGN